MANELSSWYPPTLKHRAYCFNSVNYLTAYWRVLGQTPSVKLVLDIFRNKPASQRNIDLNLLKKYDADEIVDYFMSFFSDYDDRKLMKDVDFQSTLWNLVAIYSNGAQGFEYREELLELRLFHRVMHYVSKYSFVMVRLLLSNVWGPVFVSLGHRPKVLSALLQLKHMYPLDLTGHFPSAETLAYKIPPLELCCFTGNYDVFNVLVEHTPLVPHAGYVAALVSYKDGRKLEFLIQLLARGADVNAPLNSVLQNRSTKLESSLAIACMIAAQEVTQSRCVIDYLLVHGAQFTEHDETTIRELPWYAQVEPVFSAVVKGNYNPFSAPVSDWDLAGMRFYSAHATFDFSTLELELDGSAMYSCKAIGADLRAVSSSAILMTKQVLATRTCLGSMMLLPEGEANNSIEQMFMKILAN